MLEILNNYALLIQIPSEMDLNEIEWRGMNLSHSWPSLGHEEMDLSPPYWSLGFLDSKPLKRKLHISSDLNEKIKNKEE
jgi:hypothetical protein